MLFLLLQLHFTMRQTSAQLRSALASPPSVRFRLSIIFVSYFWLPTVTIHTYIDAPTDQALVDFCMNEAGGIYYVYNNKPGDMIPISACNRDSRDFWHWVRALSLVSQFNGWAKYKDRYCDFILSQANQDGLWEFPKKFDFALSNSWRSKNKVIDSSIFVARMLNGSRAF